MIRKAFPVVGGVGEEEAGELQTNPHQGLHYYAPVWPFPLTTARYHRITNVVWTGIVKQCAECFACITENDGLPIGSH